jgi:hypothetical protein
MWLGGDLMLGIGYQQWDSSTMNSNDLRGMVEWSRQFE